MTNRSGREEEPMPTYRWSHNKPTGPGWYWFRGLAHEADGGFQEVSLANGEWAGPIEETEE